MKSSYMIAMVFGLEFVVLMLFYGYAYPIVPFWGDDFQMLSTHPSSLKPTPHSWIPARILPLYIQSGIGSISAYIIMPLSALFGANNGAGLDFLDSVSFSVAFIASSALVLLCVMIYVVARVLSGRTLASLLAPSVFLACAFLMMRTKFMPLAYPADLEAEGMGYVLTVMSFYVLPYILNLGLVLMLLLAYFRGFDNKKLMKFLLGGGGVILIYLAQFSMTTASFISASFAGLMGLYVGIRASCKMCECLKSDSAIAKDALDSASLLDSKGALESKSSDSTVALKSNKNTLDSTIHSNPSTLGRALLAFRIFAREFGLFGLICLFIVLFFISAALLDLGSGRAQYCPAFSLNFGLDYTKNAFKAVRSGFWVVFIVAFIALSIMLKSRNLGADSRRFGALLVFGGIAWLGVMSVFYMLVVSKCGAKYYLMSGLFLSYVLVLCLWVTLMLKYKIWASGAVFSVLIFGLFQSFNTYAERPRAAYNRLMPYSKAWVKEAQDFARDVVNLRLDSTPKNVLDSSKSLESSAESTLIIKIPREFHHWRWEVWFPPAFSHTLYVYGLIPREINVKFIPQDEIDSRQTQH